MSYMTGPLIPCKSDTLDLLKHAELGVWHRPATELVTLAIREIERLTNELDAERLWIKEGKKLHQFQQDAVVRMQVALARICCEAHANPHNIADEALGYPTSTVKRSIIAGALLGVATTDKQYQSPSDREIM